GTFESPRLRRGLSLFLPNTQYQIPSTAKGAIWPLPASGSLPPLHGGYCACWRRRGIQEKYSLTTGVSRWRSRTLASSFSRFCCTERAASGRGCSDRNARTSAATSGWDRAEIPSTTRRRVIPGMTSSTRSHRDAALRHTGLAGEQTGRDPEPVLGPDVTVDHLDQGGHGQLLDRHTGDRAQIAHLVERVRGRPVCAPQRLIGVGVRIAGDHRQRRG